MPKIDGKDVGLLNFSEAFRKREMTRNRYSRNTEYRQGHPDAISDGDELGKGENNGSIGGKTDIVERKKAEAKNSYTKNNQYDISKTNG
jgi:hypothetical protein